MGTKIILILIALVGLSCQGSGQDKNLSEDELKKELKSYLQTQNELSEGDSAIIYVVDLLNFDEYNGETGIYKFGVLGPHYLPYIVYVADNQFSILKDYKIVSVVGLFENFIQSNERRYTETQKVQLLKNVSGVLYTRMKMIEESSVDEDIDY
jgi:hypothetical protein